MNPAGSVLLVDDHGLVRHGLQLLIGKLLSQLRVQLAGSLAEAVQALQTQNRFDFVLPARAENGQGRARLQDVLGNGTPRVGCGCAEAPSYSDAPGSARLQMEIVRWPWC